jgi:hypothetical protein
MTTHGIVAEISARLNPPSAADPITVGLSRPLGYTAFRLTRSLNQRTAFLHVDYRKIVSIETKLQVDAGVVRVEGRKVFIAGRLLDGVVVLAEANALLDKLNPGQP